MFKVGFVMRPGREKNDRRVRPLISGQREQRLPLRFVKVRQRPNLVLIERGRQRSRAHPTVLQCVPHSGRSLCPVGDHPPVSRRRSRNVHRVRMEVHAATRHDSKTGPEKLGICEHHRGRKQTFVNELLLSVQVRKDGVEQRGALDRGAFDRGPFIRFDEQRNRIHRPRVLAAVGKVPAVVRDSLRLDQLLAALPPAAEFAKPHAPDFDEESSPMTARKPRRQQRLIPVTGNGSVFQLVLFGIGC